MCELFGLSSRKRTDCTPFLREFFSHGTEHPHGWGIAVIKEEGSLVQKEALPSVKSSTLKRILTDPVKAKLLLAHIRLATKGSIEYQNTHPFVGKDCTGRPWTLIHNGTIFESSELAGYVHKQEGSTDSERILLYLTDCVDRKIRRRRRPLSDSERYETADRVIRTIAPENKLNTMFSDGRDLYVHTNYHKGLYRKQESGTSIFSTRPLVDSGWEEVPINTLFVYRDGELVFKGSTHDFEYFDSEEKLKFLFLDYAGI